MIEGCLVTLGLLVHPFQDQKVTEVSQVFLVLMVGLVRRESQVSPESRAVLEFREIQEWR